LRPSTSFFTSTYATHTEPQQHDSARSATTGPRTTQTKEFELAPSSHRLAKQQSQQAHLVVLPHILQGTHQLLHYL
jgi:hypothetical protein